MIHAIDAQQDIDVGRDRQGYAIPEHCSAKIDYEACEAGVNAESQGGQPLGV